MEPTTWQVSDRVWACASPEDRAGDLDQVRAIAWALDPQYRCVDLWVEYERLRQGLAAFPKQGQPELPAFIVGIGRKRVEMAKAIRWWSGNRTRLVHIGRLRGSLDDLDYLITTPAFPMAPSPKVLCLDLALSDRIRHLMSGEPRSPVPEDRRQPPSAVPSSADESRWINVFLGNPLKNERHKAPQRLQVLARHLDRLASSHDKDLLISGGPRTRPELYDALGSALLSYHQIYRWHPDDPANPFELMVKGATDSVVTADSITMISQLVAAGHRVLMFPWRQKGNSLDWVLDTIRGRARKRSTKDMTAFGASLARRQLVAELDEDADFRMVTPLHGLQEQLFVRLRSFLQ
jgi:mitochondrial fission protein ELM1